MTDLELRGLGPGVNGEYYYRPIHPYSSMLQPTDKNDPQGFRGKIGGCLLRAGDRDITDRPSTPYTPPPWYPYDAQYKHIPLPEDVVRSMEGAEMLAMKMYGVVPRDAEPTFLTRDQMDEAGLYHLCNLCQIMVQDFVRNVNARWSEDDQGMQEDKHLSAKHHNNMHVLRQSAEAGCHLCSLLYPRDCTDVDLPQYEIKLSPTEMVLRTQHGRTSKVWIRPERCRPLLSTALTCHRTDETPVLDQAKEWLSSCILEHIPCSYHAPLQTSKSPEMSEAWSREMTPFRLIEVAHSDGEIRSISLTTMPEFSESIQYLTLSHCWGGADIIKLTRSSLPRFEVNIPKSQLPETFSDAIWVTAKLGFKYIWIDSLCIVQDSPEDWCKQARQMGRIYWYSQCTIAALKSTNSYGGLFCKRPILSMNDCLISKDGGSAAHHEPVFAIASRFFPEPLHTRGWVVQERYLSRRTLNFGEDMVTWKCVTAGATEQWPQFDWRVLHDPARQFFEMLFDDDLSDRVHEGHWLERWWDLITDYTGKSLTFEDDRFPAIEGLARIVQESKGISMVHGLWQPYLVNELVWSCDMEWDAPATFKSEQQRRSPSWTWISTDRKVYHYDLTNITYRPTAVVMHESDGSDETSRVSIHMLTGEEGRTLLINAPMLPIQHIASHAGKERMMGRKIQIYPFRFCDGRDFSPKSDDQYWDGHWKPDITPELDWELHAVQLIQRRYRDDHTISMGLIVYCTDEKQRLYMRIGMYEIEWGKRPEKNWRELNGMDVGYDFATTFEERDGERWFGERTTIILE